MWRKLVEEARKAGPKKLAILAVLVVIAVLLAYGNNSTNDAASGRTLPKSVTTQTLSQHALAHRP